MTKQLANNEIPIMKYIFFITYSFIINFSNENNSIKSRLIEIVSIMIFFYIFTIFSLLKMIGIASRALTFDKTDGYLLALPAYVISRYFVSRQYRSKKQFIKEKEIQYNYSKQKICIRFLFVFILPIFIFWISLLLFRNLFYK